jgi:hypothetical protein
MVKYRNADLENGTCWALLVQEPAANAARGRSVVLAKAQKLAGL